MYDMMNVITTAVHYIWELSRVNPKSSPHKGKKFLFFYFFNFVLDVHWIYSGNCFMMCVSQIIMLHTLNF